MRRAHGKGPTRRPISSADGSNPSNDVFDNTSVDSLGVGVEQALQSCNCIG
jgi:hypothetical protein